VRILVLGGAGAMAEAIERDLLESGVKGLIIADRDRDRIEARARQLGRHVQTAVLDIKAPDFSRRLRDTGADVLINSTWYELNMHVMPAAIKAGLDYIDLGGLYWKTREQLKLKAEAKRAGVTCLLGMGSTPGTMNVLARHGGAKLDKVGKVELRCGSMTLEASQGGRFVPPYAIKTIVDEVTLPPVVLRNGRQREIPPLSERHEFTLPPPVGKVFGYAMLHSELASLPAYFRKKGIKSLDFAYAADQTLLDIITALHKIGMTSREPIPVKGVPISPYDFLAELDKRLPKPPDDPKDIEMLRAELSGMAGGRKRRVRIEMTAHWHPRWRKSAGTVDTGVPPSIAAQWMASGRLHEPGVWAPEDIIEPIPYFKELNLHGRNMQVYEQVGDGPRRRLN
jgi:saccharopine dehydrogenase (NAD+, L-lysine-forming)